MLAQNNGHSGLRLSRFMNVHAGETIIIVANGPSLNQTDFSLIRHHTCIGLNKIFLGFKKFHFYPRYYIAVNPKVIAQSYKEISAMNCVKFLGDRGIQDFHKEDALTYIINTSNPPSRFSKDITQGVYEGGTVTYVALQLAYYMGAQKVVLVGLDHRYIYVGKPHESHLVEGADSNHFSDEYFGYGQTWDNPALEESEISFAIAREMFEQDNRYIVDCTLDGACSVFAKGELSKEAINSIK